MNSIPNDSVLKSLLQDAYAVIIINDKGEPMAVIDPRGRVTNIKNFDTLSKKQPGEIADINGIVNINILCKPNKSACCVSWDDKVKCWC